MSEESELYWNRIPRKKGKSYTKEEDKICDCQGTASFFWVSRLTTSSFCSQEVDRERIKPEEANQRLFGSEVSGPLFVECRNYFRVARSNKGMICAFVLKGEPEVW